MNDAYSKLEPYNDLLPSGQSVEEMRAAEAERKALQEQKVQEYKACRLTIKQLKQAIFNLPDDMTITFEDGEYDYEAGSVRIGTLDYRDEEQLILGF